MKPAALAQSSGLRRATVIAPLRRGEWLAIALAILIAHLFYWRVSLYPAAYDARSYLDIAGEISRDGLFSKFSSSDMRTYGYPLLVSFAVRLSRASGLPVGWFVFEGQLAAFLLAASFVRRELGTFAPAFAPWAFCAIVLNPFALSYTAESLTESASLALILACCACWLALLRNESAPAWPVLFGSLAVGAAVMVRPANLFLALAWIAALAAVCVARRYSIRPLVLIAAAVAAGVAVPTVPQFVNNVRNYGVYSPLIAAPLANMQQNWGVAYIKYATAVSPVPTAAVRYENPFAAGRPPDPERPLLWYLRYPRSGALTIGLHVFNMLDQDLMFTYSRDLDPWYRLPLGIFNHALIALAAAGLAFFVARAPRWTHGTLAAVALCALILSHVALHATSAAEMRFGLLLLVLAGPLALFGLRELAGGSSMRWRVVVPVLTLAYIAGALALSDWVREQSPVIREWQARHAIAVP